MSEPKKRELAKDVSAFANSAGGTLVYGIEESGGPPAVPKRIDDGIDPAEMSRERLEDLITSNISPRIPGLRIKQVLLNRTRPPPRPQLFAEGTGGRGELPRLVARRSH